MAHGVRLTPYVQTVMVGVVEGFRLLVTAADGNNMSEAVFRYRAIPIQPSQAERSGHFDGVCSPADLAEYPLDEPHADADPPWFRSATADLVFRSRYDLEQAWADIQEDVQGLVSALDLMDSLALGTEAIIGTLAEDSSSSSSGVG